MRQKLSYTVKYSKWGIFWKTVKNVIGDGFLPAHQGPAQMIPDNSLRVFQRQNGELIYIPAEYLVWFSKERDVAMRDNVNQDAGKA